MTSKLASEKIVPLLEEEDFEQLRVDMRRLVVENALLKKRLSLLEQYIIAEGWADWTVH